MIEADGVGFRYPGTQSPAVHDMSLQVSPNEVVGIVGPNGSGKSTVGRLLKGLLVPSEGRITVDGLDTAEWELEVRRRVGLVFQNPTSQIVNAVIEQEVAFGPENIGLPRNEIRRRVDEALAVVGLSGRGGEESHALSMADKQRVALASVLALEPSYLILDEPTAWIEPRHRWSLVRAVLAAARARDMALVFITHRMEEALLCQRVYGMLNGTIEAAGAPAELLGKQDIRERLALEVPETFLLGDELRRAGLAVAAGSDIEALADAICRS